MRNRSFKELNEERARAQLAQQMTHQTGGSAASNVGYNRAMYDRMLTSEIHKAYNFSQRGPQETKYLADALTQGTGLTRYNSGDVKNFSFDTARQTQIDNADAVSALQAMGVFDSADYAQSKSYVHLPSDKYLNIYLGEIEKQIEEEQKKDAANKARNDYRVNTWQLWSDFNNRKDAMQDAEKWAYADYLLNGDLSSNFSLDTYNDRWDEMDDNEFFANQSSMKTQYENLDWATLTNKDASVEDQLYESQTGKYEGYKNVITDEINRRAQLKALQNSIRSGPNYGTLSAYTDTYVEPDKSDLAYSFSNQPFIQGYDDLSRFMNTNATWAEKTVAAEYSAKVRGYLDKGYDYLTQQELADYNALYNAGRTEDAARYLELLSPELLYRRAMVLQEYQQVKATNPWLAVPTWVEAGLQQIENVFYLPQQVYETAVGKDNPYSSAYDALNKSQWTTGAQVGAINNADIPDWADKALTFAYMGVSGARDNAARLIAAGGNPTVALVLAGAQSASGSLRESSERSDMSGAAKIVKAIGTAALEVGTEKIGLDALFDKGQKGALQYMKQVILSEVGEETLNAMSEPVLEAVVAFLFDHEAEIMSGPEFWQNLTDTAITTAISSVFMGGGGAISIEAGNRSVGQQVQNSGDLEGVLRIAESYSDKPYMADLTRSIREKQAKNMKVSAREIGRITAEVSSAIGEERAQVVDQIADEAIAERLVELGETPQTARKNASAIRKISRGGKLTLAERAAIDWNDNASQVLKEMTAETTAEDAERTGHSWKTAAKEKIQEATKAVTGKASQLAEAMTTKSSTASAVGKAQDKAKSVTKGKPKLQQREMSFYEEGSGQTSTGAFERVVKKADEFVVEIKDAAGKTAQVSLDKISNTGSEGVLTIVNYAQDGANHDMSAEEVNTMVNTYLHEGGEVTSFVQQYEAAYLSGYSSIDAPASTLSEGVAAIAYEQGRAEAIKDEENRVQRAKKARKVENPVVGWLGEVKSDSEINGMGKPDSLPGALEGFTDSQRAMVEFGKHLAETAKINISFFASKAGDDGNLDTQNGSYDPNTHTIYLDINSGAQTEAERKSMLKTGTLGDAIGRVAGHELTHVLEATSPEYYAKYKQAVKAALKASGKDYASLVRGKIDTALANGAKLTYYGAEAEVIADASEYMLQDSKFVKNMEQGLKGKVKAVIQDFLNKVNEAFRRMTGGHSESRALRAMTDGVYHYEKKLQDLWDMAFDEMLGAEAIKSDVADTLYETGEIYSYTVQNSLRVRDEKTVEYLENQKHITTYRAMQVIDGELYPPMAEFIGSKKDGNREDPGVLGRWEMAVEHPELIKWVNGKPKFELKKTNDDGSVSTVPAAYNPYMHSSNTVLNDQFSKAFQRTNLVVVECVVPVSESDGAYRAQYAKDATGWHEWKSGVVAGDLAKQKSGFRRDVFLSRYIKPVRILPDTEVAEKIAEYLDGTDVAVPFQSAWPSLRDALVQAGVKITEPRGLGAAQMKIATEAFEEWEHGAASEDIRYSKRYVNNKPVVWINENILAGKPDGQSDKNFIKNYLASHIYDVYTIIESGYKVKPGKQFPAEYLYSKSAQQAERFNRSVFKGKLKMVAGIGEMIEIATNRRWEKTRHPGNKNAKYGVYRYDSNVAFQSGDKINAYSVELVVLNADDGQKYLYDIVNIKKDDATAKGLMDKARGAKEFAQQTNAVNRSVSQSSSTVKPEFDDDSSPDGIEIDDDTESAYPTQKSIRTWAESDYVTHRNEAAERLAKTIGVSTAKAKKWIDDVNSISAYILGNKARLDYIPTAVKGMSAFKSNPEYGGSIDMSTICAKRRLATGTLDAIQRVLGDAVLTKDDFLHIREMMKARGHEVACGLCFVESSRKNLSKYNKQFLDQYKAEHPDSELGMVDLNTVEGLERIRSNPDTADVYAAYEKFMNKLAQRKPKLFEKRTEYNHEVLKKFKSDTTVGIKNRNGGLRLQSFSDFEIVHLIDMMQVITDMASVGLAGQAYTKVPDFAWALGDTGLKINLSLIAKDVDVDGNLIFDDVEGMNHLEAEKLRNTYSKNVGTIVVTFTDEQTIAAMKSDFIDYIIPFHRSQWQKGDYKKLGLPEGTKDYTIHQNEKEGRKRVKENFLPNAYWQDDLSGTENARYYLDMCAKAGRTPKFAKFLVNNGDGSYSLQPDGSTDGYWKLLIDFKMYDNEGNRSKQLPVQPNFNMAQAMRMLEEYKGEHDSFPVAQDVVDAFVKEYRGDVGGVKNTGGRYTVSPVQKSIRDLPEGTTTYRDYLTEADSSIAATVEERNALSIYQKLLKNHAEASERVIEAETALAAADEAHKPEARKALAAARVKQKDLYNRLLNVERQAHVQTLVKRSNQIIGDLYGKDRTELNKMLADKERRIASLKADITGLKGAALAQREADIREQEREVAALKSNATKALLANSERYQQQIADIRLRRDINIEIGKRTRHIKRIVKKLNDRIIHEEDYKNVKEPLKPAVHKLVQTFIDGFGNMVFDRKTADRLRSVYAEIANEDAAPEFYSDDVANWLSELSDMKERDALIRAEGSFSLGAAEEKLTAYSRVAEIADHIYKLVTAADEIFIDGKREKFNAFSTETGNALVEHKDAKLLVGKARDAYNAFQNLLVKGNLTPQFFFEHLKNSGMTRLFDGLMRGQTEYAQAIREGRDVISEAKKRYNFYAWKNMKTGVEFHTEQGHDISLTVPQMMWVYATAKREATNKLMDTHHLDQGGFRYEAKDRPKQKGKPWKAVPGSDRLHKLSKADVKKITDTLTAEQKACADELVSYLSNECAAQGNRASMELFGIKKYNEEYYFPFKTDSDQRHQRSDAGAASTTNDARVKHASFTHSLRKGANTPLVISDFFDVIADHINLMATYSSFVVPIESMNRVLNTKINEEADGSGNDVTIRSMIGRKYGEASQKYIADLLKDLNGGPQTDNRGGFSALFRAFKRGAVMGSLSVTLQQPTAIVRAFAYVNPKYFAHITMEGNKKTWERMMKHSGTAVIKDMGKFDVGTGHMANDWIANSDIQEYNVLKRAHFLMNTEGWNAVKDNTIEFLTSLPGVMDRVTWTHIWKAIEAEQADLHPGMDRNSDEFLDMVGKRFDDVINHTQVYDSVLSKSQNMRSKNPLTQMSTAFMSEPTLNANLYYSAVTGDHTAGQRAGIITSVIASNLLAAAMASLISAWNKDDDERKATEKYLAEFASRAVDGLNPMTMYPFLSDLWSLASGYDIERTDLSVVKDIWDYGSAFVTKIAEGEDITWRDRENFYGTIANLFGIPAKNVSRDIRRVRNLVTTDKSASSPSSIKYTLLENAIPLGLWKDTNKAYCQRLIAAVVDGDTQEAYDLWDYLTNSKKASANSLNTNIRDELKRLVQAGEITTAQAAKILAKYAPYKDPKDNTKKPLEWLNGK